MSGQDFVSRINQVFSRLGKPKSDFYESCGVPTNCLSNWGKRGTIPSADIAVRIAQYLGTTVEWLVTGTDSSGFSDNERELIQMWRDLSGDTQSFLFDSIRQAAQKKSEKKVSLG